MKIWHPKTDGLAGGPKTFMKYFDEYFKDELCLYWEQADIVFGLNNWVPIDIIKDAKDHDIKYIHRANGVFRPILLNVPNWEFRNEEIKPHYLEADHVIFQSVFSRRGYFEYIGETDNYSIIYNGVDVDEYYPLDIASRNEVLLLGKGLTNKEQVVANKIMFNKTCLRLEKFNNMREFLRNTLNVSVVVDPDPQANCNNMDLELMALGIPVVCLAEGGNPEICLPELIASEKGIVDKVNYVLENQEFFSKRAREHVVKHFKIEDCLGKYRKVFEEVLK